jgi:hypothetical protein
VTEPAEGDEILGGRFPGLQPWLVASVMYVQLFVGGATLLTRPAVTGEDGEALLLPARIAQGAAVGGARATGARHGALGTG